METERQMTDLGRSRLISSLMVVVVGGSREPPVPADVLQIAGWVSACLGCVFRRC
jgi:hypothetical protein